MKLNNIFKRKEVKSNSFVYGGSSDANSAVFYLNNKGELIDSFYVNASQQIAENGCANIIASKHLSIIDEANLSVKEGSYDSNKSTQNPQALKFLEWLNFPNSIPSPKNKYEIFKYLIQNNYKYGISGMVFTFDVSGKPTFDNWKNIRLAKNISYSSNEGKPYYDVYLANNYRYNFSYNPNLMNFVSKDERGNLMMLVVFGNQDIRKDCYLPFFKDILPFITLQNHLINFANSFHAESCFPSQIVTCNFKTDRTLNAVERQGFEKMVNDLKTQLTTAKGALKAGALLVPNSPDIEVKITPISIPTNAGDNIAYQNFVKDTIYSFVDGGSSSAFEGKSEYSNNASDKLSELYDGAFRQAKAIIAYPLNTFMRSLLLLNGKGANANQLFFSFDTATVKIYQKREKMEVVAYTNSNIITINETRRILSKIDSKMEGVTDLPGKDIMVKELSGKDGSQSITGSDNNLK